LELNFAPICNPFGSQIVISVVMRSVLCSFNITSTTAQYLDSFKLSDGKMIFREKERERKRERERERERERKKERKKFEKTNFSHLNFRSNSNWSYII